MLIISTNKKFLTLSISSQKYVHKETFNMQISYTYIYWYIDVKLESVGEFQWKDLLKGKFYKSFFLSECINSFKELI